MSNRPLRPKTGPGHVCRFSDSGSSRSLAAPHASAACHRRDGWWTTFRVTLSGCRDRLASPISTTLDPVHRHSGLASNRPTPSRLSPRYSGPPWEAASIRPSANPLARCSRPPPPVAQSHVPVAVSCRSVQPRKIGSHPPPKQPWRSQPSPGQACGDAAEAYQTRGYSLLYARQFLCMFGKPFSGKSDLTVLSLLEGCCLN